MASFAGDGPEVITVPFELRDVIVPFELRDAIVPNDTRDLLVTQ